jgi:tetratricopeptide (TPR) repeat protein
VNTFSRLCTKRVILPLLFFMLSVAAVRAEQAASAPAVKELQGASAAAKEPNSAAPKPKEAKSAAPAAKDAKGAAAVAVDGELAAAKDAAKAEPDNPAAHARLGSLLLKRGAVDEAMLSFDKSLALNPRLAEAKTGKGIALARKGELAKAEQLLKEALQHNPDPIRIHYELGLIYQQMGDSSRAAAEFKEGIRKHMQGRR